MNQDQTLLLTYSHKEKSFFSSLLQNAAGETLFQNKDLNPSRCYGKHDNMVLMTFKERSFVLYQTKDNNEVFVHSINRDGTLCANPTYRDTWNSYYPNICFYTAGNQAYLVMQNDSKTLYIDEVSDQGVPGKTTYKSKGGFPFNHFNEVLGIVKVEEKNFLYAHRKNELTSIEWDNRFFIQELTEDGELGKRISKIEEWKHFYPTFCSLIIGSKTLLIYQSKDSNKICIQGVTREGKLSDKLYQTYKLDTFYDCLEGTIINGKHCIHGFSASKKKYYRQEINESGKFVGEPYEISDLPYGINGIATYSSNDFVFGNDWMDYAYQKMTPEKRNKATLKDFCMPASHDAGMYKLTKNGSVSLNALLTMPGVDFFVNSLALTQNLSFIKQLNRGVRYFDLRPIIKSSLTGTNAIHYVHTAAGPTVEASLRDIVTFMENGGCQETLILFFSHIEIGKENTIKLVSLIRAYLRDYLLKKTELTDYFSENSHLKKSINNLPMKFLRKKIIVVFEKGKEGEEEKDKKIDYSIITKEDMYLGNYFDAKEAEGIDQSSSLFTVFDHYADAQDKHIMIEDQLKKFQNFGKGKEGLINQSSLMAVDWTLTAPSPSLDVFKEIFTLKANDLTPFKMMELAKKIGQLASWSNERNASLLSEALFITSKSESFPIYHPNPQGRMVNFLSLDYIPGGISEICLKIMDGN